MLWKIFLLLLLVISSTFANRLALETSPYLLQHKNNPVDWYPWTDEAFLKAKKENKLIFLSIGYSTCHWCHEMAHQSFEDQEVAQLLNKNYISIKVDREQYPHIDRYYQKVYHLLNNKSGGWPLTIIMTADKKPFFAATYIPKYKGYGSAGLINILNFFSLYNRKKLQKKGEEVLKALTRNQNKKQENKHSIPQKNILQTSFKSLQYDYDFTHKGFGIRPKFPHFVDIIFLLKLYTINHNKKALTMATDALKAMARGGIYDQIEGGFFRYSTDEKWEIPHFEKMLYTNAEALQAYTLAYTITAKPLFKKIILETKKTIQKNFQTQQLYMSASNADSLTPENTQEEGYYFVFDFDTTLEYLLQHHIKKRVALQHLHYLGIEEDGNFDGESSNPHLTSKKQPENIKQTIALLQQMRTSKKYPNKDKKINTAWNALYIKGLLLASKIDSKNLQPALHSLEKLLQTFYINSHLYHQTIGSKHPTQKAILEDYTFLIATLFEAYQITLDKHYLSLYKKLLQDSIEKFYLGNGQWKESTDSFKTYADVENNGYTSALSTQISNLILYASMFEDTHIYNIAQATIKCFDTFYLARLYEVAPPIFIKSTKEHLQTLSTTKINYPFLYKKVTSSQLFLACKLKSCFSYSKKSSVVVKDIEESLSF